VITGSSCSIGAAIAKHFGEQGAKVVVEQLARILAKDPSLGAKGIIVNTISPSKPQGVIDAIVKAAPSGRLGEVGDIARVVGFLASPAAQWVNGQNVRVDWGGCHLFFLCKLDSVTRHAGICIDFFLRCLVLVASSFSRTKALTKM
jgi:NAD(P)-dependent dehydrogenase (short-subunit alcohol dehydrogenase family)